MNGIFINIFLNIKNSVFRRINKRNKSFSGKGKPEIKRFTDLDGWMASFPWGIYSEDERVKYQSEESLTLGCPMYMRTIRKHKVNHYNNVTMQWSIGCLMSKEPFRDYGTFEVIAKIHPARGCWHAPLWFVAANPEGSKDPYAILPEPDVAEVYSKGNPSKFKAKSNLHYGTDYDYNAKSIGAKTHYIPNFNSRFVSYGMVWKEDRLEYYYDGHLCRVITNRKVLDRLRHGLYPIIGVGVLNGQPHDGSLMEVLKFSYWKD